MINCKAPDRFSKSVDDFKPAIEHWLKHRCVVNKGGREKASVLFADYMKFIPQMWHDFLMITSSQKMFSMALKSMMRPDGRFLLPNLRIGGFSYFYNISIAL